MHSPRNELRRGDGALTKMVLRVVVCVVQCDVRCEVRLRARCSTVNGAGFMMELFITDLRNCEDEAFAALMKCARVAGIEGSIIPGGPALNHVGMLAKGDRMLVPASRRISPSCAAIFE